MLGWVLGACLALCDGLVWAELAAALPEAGGSYAFLREIYGPGRAGRLVSFLYVWQFTLTAPLVMASGAIGLAQYASYLYPALSMRLAASGPLQHIQRSSLLAVAVVALVVVLLYRRLRAIKRMAWVLWAGVVLTLGITIVAGFAHFDARQAFSFPAGAFQLNHRFLIGLGAAMLIATYDYWGYYTIAYLAGEVRDPGRTLPRTIIGSILIIAALYLLMNISVLGVIPWQEFTNNRPSASHTAMVAELLGAASDRCGRRLAHGWLSGRPSARSSRCYWALPACSGLRRQRATTSARWHGCTPAEDFRRTCCCCWAPSRASAASST